MSKEDLANNLRHFYACVRKQPEPGSMAGEDYSRSGYRNIRAGLQRHLVSPPHNRQINIMSDIDFQKANQVFNGKIKGLKKEGKDVTKHKPAIAEEDMALFYKSGVLSDTNPTSLQRKVFVELALHFGRRGREGWRTMKKNSFSVNKDAKGRDFVTLNYNECDKNHQDAEQKMQCMFATYKENCPVASFQKYVQKLNPECEWFLQRPLASYEGKRIWYANAPLGVNSIGNMLKGISRDAGSSVVYTNHSIKASTATILKQNGFQPIDIMAVTGHRNVASLNSYSSGPTMDDRAEMSKQLAIYGKENSSEDHAVELNIYNQKVSPATMPASNSNMAIENRLSSLFAGATFNGNVTINVNVNK